jgi:hypothetical protein
LVSLLLEFDAYSLAIPVNVDNPFPPAFAGKVDQFVPIFALHIFLSCEPDQPHPAIGMNSHIMPHG